MFAGCMFGVACCPCAGCAPVVQVVFAGCVPVVLVVFAGCALTELVVCLLVVCLLLHAVLVVC